MVALTRRTVGCNALLSMLALAEISSLGGKAPQSLARVPPSCEAEVVVGGFAYRVQGLSSTLVRLEARGALGYENRSTWAVANSSWPGETIKITQINGESANITLGNSAVFGISLQKNSPVLSIRAMDDATLWHGDISNQSTAVSNRMLLPTPSAVYTNSRQVWAIRDGPRFVPPTWGAAPAPIDAHILPELQNTSGFDMRNDAFDGYFFLTSASASPAVDVYGRFVAQVLRLTGPINSLPDYAFGLWFSWYHPYSQSEKLAEIARFEADGIPLDVVGIDMGWRVRSQQKDYVIDTKLFPDMRTFLSQVHATKQHVYFNDHPFRNSTQMSPAEIAFRYDGLTSLMDLGLDFWWCDCHWSGSGLGGIHGSTGIETDSSSWSSYVYMSVQEQWRDHQVKLQQAKPSPNIMLGCPGAHISAHRHGLWWTGDISYLDLFGSVADMINSAFNLRPYTHPDCGGNHVPEEHHQHYAPEVYVRWIQFCSLGSIFRIHTDQHGNKQPWAFGDSVEKIVQKFVRLRYSLLPMLIAAGARASEDGTPIVRRLDYEFPEAGAEAERLDQYLLGDDLLVAPITPFGSQINATLGPFNRSRTVWLPPGQWVDNNTGKVLVGNQTVHLDNFPLDQIPTYHRSGGILARMLPAPRRAADIDYNALVLDVFPFPWANGLAGDGKVQEAHRFLHDSTSDAPCSWRTHLSLIQQVGSGLVTGHGLPTFTKIVVRIVAPHLHDCGLTDSTEKLGSTTRAHRVRLHLTSASMQMEQARMKLVTSVDGQSANVTTMSEGGHSTVELRLDPRPASQSREIQFLVPRVANSIEEKWIV